MEPEEVRRQVDLFADAGVGGVMLHSRIGLLTPYMGEEWFAAVAAAIDQAERRGIAIWLYDEDKWPSGFAGGDVVAEHPEHRMMALTVRPADDATPPDCEPIGAPVDGLQVHAWRSPLGCEQFNGTCYTSLLNPAAVRYFLDLAYEPYFKRFGERFGSTIPAIFTDEPAVLFRRRLIHPAMPYAFNVPAAFETLFGYDPRPHLTKLFVESDGYRLFRLHYHRTIGHLFETAFTQQLGDWCRAHRIALTGHFVYEQGLVEQQLWGVDMMPNYRHMDIPGIDHLGRQTSEKVTAIQCRSVANQYGKRRVMSELDGASGQDMTFEDRKWIGEQQICLGVNQFVPHLSLYTMSGCRKRDFPPTLSSQQPWWPRNRVIDDTLGRLCAALSQGDYEAELAVLHPQESIALHWTPIVDKAQFEGLVEYDHDPVRKDRAAELDAINNDFKELTSTLLSAQRTFDYLHEKLLEEDGSVERGADGPRLVLGRMRYPLVVLPSMTTLRPRTLELLLDFIAAGGPVLQVGAFPVFVDAVPDARLEALRGLVRHVENLEALPSVLAAVRSPVVELLPAEGTAPIADQAFRKSCEPLMIHRRRVGDSRLLFVVNLSRQERFEGRLRWRGIGGSVLERLDPIDGKVTGVPCHCEEKDGTIEFALAPGESRLLLASSRSDSPAEPSTSPSTGAGAPERLTPYQVEQLDDNAFLLDYVQYRIGNREWSARPVPLMAVQEYLNGSRYDGPLSLRFTFESRLATRRDVRLIVEYPERWRVTVNGQAVVAWGSPWRDHRWLPGDISGLLRSGGNVIELHTDVFRHGDLCCYGDPVGRYGTEAESLMLVGDFSVEGVPLDERPVCPLWTTYGLPQARSCSFEGPFVMVDPQPLGVGDVTGQGLPFYTGRLRYRYRVRNLLEGVTLKLGGLDAVVADVAAHGRPVGAIVWAPYELKLTSGAPASQGGAQAPAELDLTLCNSLRNLLGPHHHPQGLMPVDYPGAYTADPYRVREPDGSDKAWLFAMERGEEIETWKHRYIFRPFGMTDPVWLVPSP